MGLDMYLERINRKAIKYDGMDFYISNEEKNDTALYQEIKPFLVDRGSENYRYKSLSEEIGYWRKDNHIHNWFVENVQEGVDDCSAYEVTPEQLVELRNVCQTVLDASVLVDGKVYNGTSWTKDGGEKVMWGDGKTIEDSTVAKELLPRAEGFFFGGQYYDEYYYSSLEQTIQFIDEALKTNFETHAVRYSSSW